MWNSRIYLITGVLALAVIVLGVWIYQERQRTPGIDITIGKGGISVESR